MSIIFIGLVLVLFSLYLTKDILNPVVIGTLPMLLAVFLHNLEWSDYYINNESSIIYIVYLIPIILSLGMLTSFLYLINNKKVLFNLSTYNLLININAKKISQLILGILFIILVVFAVESTVQTPPLFSHSPTSAYLNYGLPIIHHFITFIYIAIFLSVIYQIKTGRKVYVFFTTFLAIGLFTILMTRMQILFIFIILFFSYYYIYRLPIRKILFYLVLLLIGFYFIFAILGSLRTSLIDSTDYYYRLAKFNQDNFDSMFVQFYLYITVNIQNLYLFISNYNNMSLGGYLIMDMFPLLKPQLLFNIDFANYRVQEGLTTFMFGKVFYIDFGYFFFFFIYIFGFLLGYFYSVMYKNIILFSIYIVVIAKSILMLFFSDVFFSTNNLILIIFTISFVNYINKKKVRFNANNI